VTGVLSRLIDHALDPGGSLQPRTLGRFEPARGRPDDGASAAPTSDPAATAATIAVGPMADVADGPPGVEGVARSTAPDRAPNRRPALSREHAPQDPIEVAEAPSETTGRGPRTATATPSGVVRSLPPSRRRESLVVDAEAVGPREPSIRHEANVLPGPAFDELSPPERDRPAGHEPHGDVPWQAAAAPSIERALPGLPALPAPRASDLPVPEATSPAVRDPRRSAPDPASASPDRRRPPRHGVPSSAETGSPEPTESSPRIAVARIRHQVAPLAPGGAVVDEERWRPTASSRAGPVVRVSIGRIEVRAVNAAASPPRTAAAPRSAAPSLEDYLRARNATGR
jgi:hypothetical protein